MAKKQFKILRKKTSKLLTPFILNESVFRDVFVFSLTDLY